LPTSFAGNGNFAPINEKFEILIEISIIKENARERDTLMGDVLDVKLGTAK
jgi:hypothetical protein